MDTKDVVSVTLQNSEALPSIDLPNTETFVCTQGDHPTFAQWDYTKNTTYNFTHNAIYFEYTHRRINSWYRWSFGLASPQPFASSLGQPINRTFGDRTLVSNL
ncbi:uncharacterized protein METZ01_LOCUS301233, partial [marine metagenome]